MMVTQTTQDFIATRTKTILLQIKELQQELAALRSLKSSLYGVKTKQKTHVVFQKEQRKSGLTFQDMIVDVLSMHPEYQADANEILGLIKNRHNKEILRSSISPQLSRLKERGVLNLVNNNWVLTEEFRPKKNEDPEGSSNTVAEAVFD